MLRKNSIILRVPLILALFIFLASPAILWASDITSAEWQTKIVVSNNGTAATDVSTNFTLSTSEMVAADMLNSDGTDAAITTAIGDDTAFMPGVGNNPWCVWVSSIDASSIQNLYLYTSNVTEGKIRYFPGADGMTVGDDASLELSDNFSVEIKGYVNGTSMGSALADKGDGSFTISTKGDGLFCAINISNWTIRSSAANNSWSGIAWSPELGLFAAVAYSGTGNRVMTSPDGVNWTIRTSAADNDWRGIAWSPEMGLFAAVAVTGTGDCVMTSPDLIIIIELNNAEYKVAVYADTANLTIEIDGVVVGTIALGGISVSDDDSDWVFCEAGAVPYMEYVEVTVDGVQRGYWEWENDTTFTDQSGNGNDATPTFRTASSDADVSAYISEQTSLVTTANPSSAALGGWTMITEIPDEPSGIYDEGGTSFPWGTEIEEMANKMRLPKEVFLFPLAFGTAILIGCVAFGLTHRQKMGIKGSLLIMCFVIEGVLIVWYKVGGGVIPGWSLVPFGLIAVLLLLWKNPYNPTA